MIQTDDFEIDYSSSSNLSFNSIESYKSNYLNSTIQKSQLKILQLNAQSIVNINRFEELKLLLHSIGCIIHVVIISETWLKNTETSYYSIPNYEPIFACRDNKKGGGIAAYIHNSINFEVVEINSSSFEKIHFLLKNIHSTSFNELSMIAYYRPPDSQNVTEFMLDLEQSLYNTGNKKCLVVGDINFNLLANTQTIDNYKMLLGSLDFHCCNTKVTRNSSNSILDHVVSNFCELIHHHTDTIDFDLSDHNIVITDLRLVVNNEKHHSIEKKFTDYVKTSHLLLNAYQDRKPQTNDPNILFNFLITELSQSLQKTTTITKIKLKKSYDLCPWVNSSITDIIKNKNNLRTKLKKLNMRGQSESNRALSLKIKIDEICLKINKMKRSNMREYNYKMFGECKTMKETWRNINKVLGRTQKKTEINCIFNHENEKVEISENILDIFGNYFQTIGENLMSKLNSIDNSDPNKYRSLRSNMNSIFLKFTNEEEVSNIIQKLDTTKGAGIDNIKPFEIKKLVHVLCAPLAEIFNCMIVTGIFPDALKQALVIPIFKDGKKTDFKNYRPISILTTFNKIFERMLFQRMYSFLHHISYFYEFQYGFRPKSNTSTAAVELVNSISKDIDSGKVVTGLFLDLSKAFDTVNFKILAIKLEAAGIRGVAKGLILSYLENRSQFVIINGKRSKEFRIKMGVPQGSILGPLLYLIYINDMGNLPIQGRLQLYADDCALFYADENVDVNITKMQSDMQIIADYFLINKLTLNVKKSKFIHFHPHQKKINLTTDIKFNNDEIENVKVLKYLGMNFDSNLTYEYHINTIAKRLSPTVGLIRKLKYSLPKSILLNIYYSLIHSNLNYMSLIWGSASKTNLNKLQVLQNRAMKYIYNLPFRHSTLDIYLNVVKTILPVRALYKYQLSTHVHSVLNDCCYYTTGLNYKTNERTRSGKILDRAKIRTEIGRRSLEFSGPSEYNVLPDSIKNLNIHKFKKEIKKWLLNENILIESLKN